MISITFIEELKKSFHPDSIILHHDELKLYASDGLQLNATIPGLVILPETTEQVIQIIKLCNVFKIPFTARGAGTGLSGGAVSDGGVIIQLSKMNNILELDIPNRIAVVQPGVVNMHLSQVVREYGLHFAPDPSSQIVSTIGGNTAENAGGPHTLKYGVTTHHILGQKIVLPNGSTVAFGNKLRYQNGFDFSSLFTGSEGTLGITTEITVELTPIPETAVTFLMLFSHTHKATDMVSDILKSGIIPAALEFMDNLCIRAVEKKMRAGYPINAEAVLLIELDGEIEKVKEESNLLIKIASKYVSDKPLKADDKVQREKLWKGRKHAAGAMGLLAPAYYTNDGVVPRHRLTDLLQEIYTIGDKFKLQIANLCHAGDGNIHPLILYDPGIKSQLVSVIDCSAEILQLCLDFGGSLTGEHGIGTEKKNLIPRMFNPIQLKIMREIKRIFDPDNLNNPGKIFPTKGSCGELNILNGYSEL